MTKGTDDFLDDGEKMLSDLGKLAKGFDEKFKLFTAWLRLQEMKQRVKRGNMGTEFDELGGGQDERPGDL